MEVRAKENKKTLKSSLGLCLATYQIGSSEGRCCGGMAVDRPLNLVGCPLPIYIYIYIYIIFLEVYTATIFKRKFKKLKGLFDSQIIAN